MMIRIISLNLNPFRQVPHLLLIEPLPSIWKVAMAGGVLLLLYGCYRVSVNDGLQPSSRSDVEVLDPEVVRERTSIVSDEPLAHSAYPPGEGPNARTGRQGSATAQSKPGSDEITDHESLSGHQSGLKELDLTYEWARDTGVSFDDVGGMADVKEELRIEVLKPIENPEKASKLGVSAPNILFHGPPGTGKTYLTKALASELGRPFAKLSAADIQSKWINQSSQQVNTLFQEAAEVAERCNGAVIFIDELDSVLKSRDGAGNSHAEDKKVVNEFLTRLEETRDKNIVFVGATNRLDSLDSAGIRSGRIDNKIRIGYPDASAREAILRTHLDKRDNDISDPQLAQIAAETKGLTAADLDSIVRKASKCVLAREGSSIMWRDLRRALSETDV